MDKIEQQLKRNLKHAKKGLNIMEGNCGEIASILQPYFNQEISVLYQYGDGFCVEWEEEKRGRYLQAPHNVDVMTVFQYIKQDPNHYKH